MVLLKHGPSLERKPTKTLIRPIPEFDHSSLDNISNTSTLSFTASSTSSRACVSTITTDNTLNMIDSPWSTEESWNYLPLNWHNEISTSTPPKSTSSNEIPSPGIRSTSRNTLTILSRQDSKSYSEPIPIKSHSEISFWTVESFTSTGLISTERVEESLNEVKVKLNEVKVKYPWSPGTCASDVDLTYSYPNSLTFISQKGSRESVETYTKKTLKETLTPMNCTLKVENEYNPFFDWALVKRSDYWVIKQTPRIKKKQ